MSQLHVSRPGDRPDHELLESRLMLDAGPVAADDFFEPLEDHTVSLTVTDNDDQSIGAPGILSFDAVTTAGGTVVRDDADTPWDMTDDVLVYTPPADYYGPDSFTYVSGPFLVAEPALFESPVLYTPGSGPEATAAGDFNGDGVADLATADTGSDTVTIYLGVGDGTFQASWAYRVADGPTDLVAADFNGDGFDDLAVAATHDDSVVILTGAAQSMDSGDPLAVGGSPTAIVTGDYNGDGLLDVVTVNYTSGDLTLLPGLGDGSFAGAETFDVGAYPVDAYSADFNGDGRDDVAVVNWMDDTISVLRGSAAGFGTARTYPTSDYPTGIIGGDVTGDGRIDLVIIDGHAESLTIMDGTGSGDFSMGREMAISGRARTVVLGDVTRNGRLDIVIAGQNSAEIVILAAGSGGTFVDGGTYDAGLFPSAMILEDVNGDFVLDLAIVDAWNSGFSFVPGRSPVVLVGEAGEAAVTLDVLPVNDVPSFTKGPDITIHIDGEHTYENWATAMSVGPANEAHQTFAFVVTTNHDEMFDATPVVTPEGELKFTPMTGAQGDVTVNVFIQDSDGTPSGGVDSSAAQSFVIHLDPQPQPTDDVAATLEDTLLIIDVIDVLANDESVMRYPGPVIVGFDGFSVNGGVVILDGDALAYTPAADFNGTDSFTYTIQGMPQYGTATATVTIDVTAVNDAPVFAVGADLASSSTDAVTVDGWIDGFVSGPADEVAQTVWFEVTGDREDLFDVQPTVSPEGVLTYTSTAGVAGAATVSVVMRDDGGVVDGGQDASVPQTFFIFVTLAPVAGDNAGSTLEDERVAVNVLVDDSVPVGLVGLASFQATSAFGGAVTRDDNGTPDDPTDDQLAYTPAADFNGIDTFTYTVGSYLAVPGEAIFHQSDLTDTATVTIGVTAVNDAPSFTPGASQNLTGEAVEVVVPHWAADISAGPADEAGQTVAFEVIASSPELFAVQPSLSADGTLTYTPAAGALGTTLVLVSLHDDGGTANGGADWGAAIPFLIGTPNPVAVADGVEIDADVAVDIPVLDNDTSVAGMPALTAFDAVSTEGGTITLDNGGTVDDQSDDSLIYTPKAGFSGIDTFTYTIGIQMGATVTEDYTSTATVTIDVDLGDAPRALAADANRDGAVDLADFMIVKANFGVSSGADWGDGDFTGDGKIDLADFTILKANFGAVSAIPGDADNNGAVELADFQVLKANFGTASGATWLDGDFTGDGAVDINDFVIIKKNFGLTTAAASAPAAIVAVQPAGSAPALGGVIDLFDQIRGVIAPR